MRSLRKKLPALATLAFAAAANWLVAGCSEGWPSVRAMGDAAFLAHGGSGVAQIDVLPVDVHVTAWAGSSHTADEIAPAFDASVLAAVSEGLAERGYQVGALIDWNGRYATVSGEMAVALTPEQVEATARSMSTFGFAQAQSPGRMLVPYLPARLGEATGGQATLYLGGYAFSGEPDDSIDAGDIAKGIFIAAFIVVVVAIALIGLKHSGSGGAEVADAVAHGVSEVAGGIVHGAGRLATHSAEGFLDVADAFGRTGTNIEIYVANEDRLPELPTEGPSQMLIEMTLIDNRDGRALWHARQTFPADPASPEHVHEVIGRMLATLPARR